MTESGGGPGEPGVEESGRRSGIGRWFRDVGIILLSATAAALFLRAFVLEALHIPSHSMEPALCAGDFLLVNKLPYGSGVDGLRIPPFKSVERGDVVAFRTLDGDQEEALVKRCLALPGDSVAVVDGAVWVNAEKADPPCGAAAGPVPPGLAGHVKTWIVPRAGDVVRLSALTIHQWERAIQWEGHTTGFTASRDITIDSQPVESYRFRKNYYFLAGDNRADSYDSRFWGPVAEDALLGKAFLVYWSRDVSTVPGADPAISIRWRRIGTLVH
jgi:signal peptidase I